MTGEIAERGNHRKYIPVLARGAWSEAVLSCCVASVTRT